MTHRPSSASDRELPTEQDTCDAIAHGRFADTGFSYTMSLIQGKYKMTILYVLMLYGVVRFNELQRYIGRISYKTLSATLKQLEADGLVHREEYPQIPPRVEYSLTERGASLMPVLDQLCTWGETHREDPIRSAAVGAGGTEKMRTSRAC